jgi:hypothetical protein
MKLSQSDLILAHMQAGNRISPIEALEKFHCFRLASRINELGKKYEISRERVTNEVTGKHWEEYWIEKPQSYKEG